MVGTVGGRRGHFDSYSTRIVVVVKARHGVDVASSSNLIDFDFHGRLSALSNLMMIGPGIRSHWQGPTSVRICLPF